MFTAGEGNPTVHKLALPLAQRFFPPLFGSRSLQITRVRIFAKWSEGAALGSDPEMLVWAPGAPLGGQATESISLKASGYGQLRNADLTKVGIGDPLKKTYTILSETAADFAPWTLQLGAASTGLEDVWVICDYQLKP